MAATRASNEAIVRRLYEQVERKGDLSFSEEIYDDHFINHGASSGLQGLKERYKAIHAAFPDWQETIEQISAKGDKIIVRSVVRGTHQGQWMGIAPTGKRVSALRITILRTADGKIVERWGSQDELGLMQQLGAIPPGSRRS